MSSEPNERPTRLIERTAPLISSNVAVDRERGVVVPTRRFAIDRGAAKRLSISWERGGRTLRVFLDGLELPSTMPAGNDFRLPDGRPLAVDVDAASGTVDVICDGDFLPGTRFDPHHQLLLAYVTLFLVGTLHIAVAFLHLGGGP